MTLLRPDLWQPFPGFASTLPSLFEDFLGSTPSPTTRTPALNAFEDEDGFAIEVELPGLTLDDVEVLVQGNLLTLKGEFRERAREGVTTHRRELATGKFERSIQLPEAVDSQAVQAVLQNGVLTVTLPKVEAARPRKIDVRVAN